MSAIGIMHVVDSLEAGGAERVAVNLVNHLSRERYTPYLCTTRREGPLTDLVSQDVVRLQLRRRHRYDAGPVSELVRFIRQRDVRILHAHSTSLFIAAAASCFSPHPAVIWHDHFGRYAVEERPVFIYRQAARRISGVIAVNEALAQWSRVRLRLPSHRVWYVPNFAALHGAGGVRPELPGTGGARMVCVANLRAEKDHLTLLHAFELVRQQAPSCHLLLVGRASDPAQLDRIQSEIRGRNLGASVSYLGERRDMAEILANCDIGVLSSASEGLPLALLEYGMAGLPAVATSVGQCAEVLDGGRCGVLVPPRSAEDLARALLMLLRSPEERARLGLQLQGRVEQLYSPTAILERVCDIYRTVLLRN